MYILDTNVVSELRKAKDGRADRNVTVWAASIAPAEAFLSVVTILEIAQGILQVERRDTGHGILLRTWFEERVLPPFAERILPIAATGPVRGMTVVTRNVKDFAGTGVAILNPFSSPGSKR